MSEETERAEQQEGSRLTRSNLFQGLSFVQILVCAWPLGLIAVGGLIGGLCGGLAFGINAKVMRGSLPAPARYGLCVAIGLGAVLLYFAIAVALAVAFPDIFARR